MKKMKLALMTIALAAISTTQLAAMSLSEIRNEARFLTDRMGHELGLSNRQYEDVYEINFDFLYQANEVIDDMVYGYDDAIDYYYYLLDMRNEDLMYVLNNSQYRKFVERDYFYRPLYMTSNTWRMRIWDRYTDRNYFYFGKPAGYLTYSGAHGRIHFTLSFYANRYTHDLFLGAFRLWGAGYAHHAHDGWRPKNQRKYTTVGSRPWSNAKNYEKSRKNLKEGYVNVPSRDASKRKVMINSEENRRTAMKSGTPIRKRGEEGKAHTGMHNKPTGKPSDKPESSVRNNNGSAMPQRGGNMPSQRNGSVGSSTQRSNNGSASSRPSSMTSKPSGSTTSQRSSSVGSSTQRSSNGSASSRPSSMTSKPNGSTTSQRSSSVGSSSHRSSSSSSSSARSSSTSQRSGTTSQRSR